MKKSASMFKNLLKKCGADKIARRLYKIFEAARLKGGSRERIFTRIYERNAWKGKESRSGRGSDLDETRILREALPEIFARCDVHVLVDLPCGDFHWMRQVPYRFERYIGLDIVDGLIAENNRLYGDQNHIFKKKDCLKDRIDDADILFCRDLLIHLNTADIFIFFRNLQRSRIPLLLTTHFLEEEEQNTKIATGQWRPVNLTAAPFHFPPPQEMLLEGTQMGGGRFAATKGMGLWRMEDVFAALESNPLFDSTR